MQYSLPVHEVRPPRAIVIGFMGGNVPPTDTTRNELIISESLRAAYPQGVHLQVFENRHFQKAHQQILQWLGVSAGRSLSAEQNNNPKIILYGHSWGASAVVALADELQKDGIPVALTIQVDSIERGSQNDAVIPPNVSRAINFYQADGIFHGRARIRAADPARTQILGNFEFTYKELPPECSSYPWYERMFTKTHIAIECDPVLWKRIENLIRAALDAPPAETSSH